MNLNLKKKLILIFTSTFGVNKKTHKVKIKYPIKQNALLYSEHHNCHTNINTQYLIDIKIKTTYSSSQKTESIVVYL